MRHRRRSRRIPGGSCSRPAGPRARATYLRAAVGTRRARRNGDAAARRRAAARAIPPASSLAPGLTSPSRPAGTSRRSPKWTGTGCRKATRSAAASSWLRLRDAEYQQKLVQAQAQQVQADAALAHARTALDRATALRAARGLTLPELEAAQTAFEAATSRAAVAKAVTTEAQIALDDTVLRAPMNGVVLKRLVERGALVAPGTPAVALADISEVRVAFGATDVLLPRLTREASRSSRPKPIQARSSRAASSASRRMPIPRSRVFDIRIAVPNPTDGSSLAWWPRCAFTRTQARRGDGRRPAGRGRSRPESARRLRRLHRRGRRH